MKYPHTGLFEYCHHLGLALKDSAALHDHIKYYLRDGDQQYFDPASEFLVRKVLHKFIFPNYSKVDLWHITHQTSVYVPKSDKIKKVLTIHDLNFLYEEKPAWKQKNYLQKHQRNIDRADHIVAISNFTKNDILKYLHTDGKPITVIYNGCADVPVLKDLKPSYQPSAPFLFALGTVNAKKNFHVLIPLLVNNDMELIISGRIDPAYQQKIMDEAQKYNVTSRVKVTGPVSDQDKAWYFKNCEAFLFPSLAEGFGIPPIEAMRFGKPTFLSRTTSLPEIGGTAAYYFDNYDPEHMQKVFRDGMNDYQQKQPAADIIKHASQFNWETSAAAYWKVYKETLTK
ncbi:glycosyltransferase family 1 protein [Pedobacter sp. L105]|uniref:glycosyltransferase family 4 protein n=1 Tax=Pedobacter sp. L105 TaxID=1641871 RepID=UPI00131B644B|nr:glycosyltransferase family 1 protein [Pedobacter sp. L105]